MKLRWNNCQHLDAAPSAFIAQQLQFIEAEVAQTPFGPIKWAKFVPLWNGVPRGAREHGFDRVTKKGMAKLLASAAKDIPRVNIEKKRVTYPILEMSIGYGFTVNDLEAAAFAGVPLNQQDAEGARERIDEFVNSMVLFGKDPAGNAIDSMTGLINDPVVPQASAGTGNWLAATADQVLADLAAGVAKVRSNSKESREINTILVDGDIYEMLNTKFRSTSSDATIWESFAKSHPGVVLDQLAELKTAGSGATRRALYYKKDPSVLRAVVPIPFEQLAGQEDGLEIFFPCRGTTGGMHWREPVAAFYQDGL